MKQTAQIIAFPTPKKNAHEDIGCVCCKFRYQPESELGYYDIEKNTITVPGDASDTATIYQIDQQSFPAASSGSICSNCIDVLSDYRRLSVISEQEHTPQYEISFLSHDGANSGYAFLCYDTSHWRNFMCEMERNLQIPNLTPTSFPNDAEFPCLVICRGASRPEVGPRQLITEVLPQACVFRHTG